MNPQHQPNSLGHDHSPTKKETVGYKMVQKIDNEVLLEDVTR